VPDPKKAFDFLRERHTGLDDRTAVGARPKDLLPAGWGLNPRHEASLEVRLTRSFGRRPDYVIA
jgi:hypothetical protein